jgi:hypothetical protein
VNLDWTKIRQQARVVYAAGAQLMTFLAVCFYLLACLVAAKPLGPKGYVSFTYYCFQWPGPGQPVVVKAAAKPTSDKR